MKLSNSFQRLWAAMILAVLVLAPSRLQGEPTQSEYRGFTIDESRIQNAPALEEIRKTIKEQIDIVFAVGLPADIEQFFQSVPFVLIPSDAIPRSSPGLYQRQDRSVKITSRIVTIGARPVLVHELLHAYHHQKLPGGFNNRGIIGFFEKAKVLGAYAPKSHMMQSQGEFFACAATTYLFGVTAQEPFRRDKVKDSQPEFFAYLKTLFGPNAGSYAGSLNRETLK
jgi:hypothetical protein